MKAIFTSSLLLVFLYAIIYGQTEDPQKEINNKRDVLQKKIWETTGLSVPESVLPLPEKGILYVSNVGAATPLEKEGKGFISILGMDGKIKTLKWCQDLNSPKGMAIAGDKLYVSEVDRVGEIDLNSGKKLQDYPIEGALFLNDIAADKNGSLYISDSKTGTVHLLKEGQVSVFVQSDDFPFPNGLAIHEDHLLLGTGDKIVKIDLTTREINDYMLNTGGVDGLAVFEQDILIFSDWPGTVYLMEKGEEKQLLLDTSSSETSKTADFGYVSSKKLIYIPTFFANSVVCYKLER